MAENTLETIVTTSEVIAGRTIFEIADETERSFGKVFIGQNTVLPLQPVHYKYIDPAEKHPRRFAVIGEYPLAGKTISLIA